jgi:rod shape-determining protein MreD
MSLLDGESSSPGERIRRMIPALCVLLGLVLMALPLPLAWGVMPHIALLMVVIWASLQPRLMPAWAALLLGLVADLVTGLPFGVNGLIFVLAVIAVRLGEARVERHSLLLDWLFVSLLILASQLLLFELLAFAGREAALAPLVVQALVTMLAYPPVAALAARIQRKLIDFGG